jgi:Ca2+-binding EF-hand superfamily protein
MLAVSCFKASQVIIVNVDIKTRSKTIKQTFQNKHNPTYLYQIDVDHILVGTEAGTFEIWNISAEEAVLAQVVVAHDGSKEGISSILELENPSSLISGADEPGEEKYLVSTARDLPEILIWKLSVVEGAVKLAIHIKIATTFESGIKYVLQTSPIQLVCVNHEKTLKFYDFVDKRAQKEKKELEKQTEEFSVLVGEAFREADDDGNGWLDIDEIRPMCESLIRSFGEELDEAQKEQLLNKMFDWLDCDNSGKVTFHEFKVCLMRAFIKRSLPDELVVQ